MNVINYRKGIVEMLVFWVEYPIAVISAIFNSKRNKRAILLCFAVFAYFYVFRVVYGGDIEAYRLFYNNAFSEQALMKYGFEPGYVFINRVFRYINFPADAFFMIISAFFIIAFWKGTEKFTTNTGVALVVSLYYVFFQITGAIRQGISVFIFYNCFHLLYEKSGGGAKFKWNDQIWELNIENDIRLLICIIICILFHRSAVLLVFIWLANNNVVKRVMLVLSIALGILLPYIEIYLSKITFFYGKFSAHRIDMEPGGSSILSFRMMEYVIFAVLLLLKRNRTSMQQVCLNMLEIGIIIQAVLANYINVAYRFLAFTDVAVVVSVVQLYELLKGTRKKILFALFLSLYIGGRFYRISGDDISMTVLGLRTLFM